MKYDCYFVVNLMFVDFQTLKNWIQTISYNTCLFKNFCVYKI